ncbi:MAG: thiol-disulfide oxidoreductase DCC family protein [Chitinophagales bacterium]
MSTIKNKTIILFDGVCNLCNGFVQFIIKRDKKERFVFGALQSERAKELLAEYQLPKEKMDSVVLIENGKVFTQSTAALRIAKKLDGGWSLTYAFIVIPKFLRDWIYGLIAKYRYKIFGKKDVCMVPTPEFKKRFIN